jgi:hypothetical protein
MNIDSTGQSSQPRSERGHQRSRSAIIAPPFDGSPRASNGTLHTLEEEGGNVDRRYSQQPLAGRRSTRSFAQQESIGSADVSEPQSAMSSLRDMINTLKQMPPDEPMQRTVLSHRKQQSMSSVPAYSRQNRVSQHDTVNAQTLRNIADNRRNSAIHSKHLSMADFSRLSANDDDEDDFMSRADALAEAEAKLMGTYQKPERQRDTADETKSQRRSRQIYAQPGGGQFGLHENEYSDQRHSRRLSEPNAAKYDPRRYSDLPETSTSYTNNRSSMSNKRMSLHMPTLNETGEDPNRHGTSRRINFNKPLDLGQDSNKRRSRNFDDWRSSKSTLI